MPVKKLTRPKKSASRLSRASTNAAAKRLAKVSQESLASIELPTAPREYFEDPSLFTGLLYGRAGIGKTTWCSSWPGACVMSFERVSKGLRGYFDFNWENGGVTSWPVFIRAVDLLEERPLPDFPVVVIDTGDTAYRRCLEYVCAQRGVDHPEDEGWGKGWNEVRKEFTLQIKRIADTGRGVWFISHSRQTTIKSFSGAEFTRIEPTLPGQAYELLRGISDITFYAEYMTDRKGNERRVLITCGDELVEAKSPKALGLPKFIPLLEKNGTDILRRAIAGEDVGIPSNTLLPGKRTPEAVTKLLRAEASQRTATATPAKKAVARRK